MQGLNVNLYLSTLPAPGGLTLVEAMSIGLPIIFHSCYSYPGLAMHDLVYPEAMVWRDESDFDQILDQLSSDNLAKHHAFSLNHFNRFHSIAQLSSYLSESPIKGKAINLSELELRVHHSYQHDELRSYIDQLETRKINISTHMSFRSRLIRKIKRLFTK